jgi:hypothetical protein
MRSTACFPAEDVEFRVVDMFLLMNVLEFIGRRCQIFVLTVVCFYHLLPSFKLIDHFIQFFSRSKNATLSVNAYISANIL